MPTRTEQMIARYGGAPSDARIRQVWAAVTRRPGASCRELAAETKIDFTTVATALRFLHDCGYIRQRRGEARARTILLPFVLIERETL